MQYIVRDRQCLLDIALQTTGSATAAFDIALLNGLSITEELVTGALLKVPDSVANKEVVQHFKTRNVIPASVHPLDSLHEGIGYWYLETINDVFIVS